MRALIHLSRCHDTVITCAHMKSGIYKSNCATYFPSPKVQIDENFMFQSLRGEQPTRTQCGDLNGASTRRRNLHKILLRGYWLKLRKILGRYFKKITHSKVGFDRISGSAGLSG